jgi:hypothetical protein
MAEGIEIVIGPRQLREMIYIVVIIALVVLLIIKWNGGCDTTKETKGNDVPATTGLNQTNQTLNATTNQTPVLCTNGIKDQDEADIDCGGTKCSKCAEFKACNVNTDCVTGWCRDQMKCLTPTCDDGIKNQDETNIDCGGKCTASKGAFYYDAACHKEAKPVYSGEVKLVIKDVETSTTDSGEDIYAKIVSVTFTVSNDKDTKLSGAMAYVFARESNGQPMFVNSATDEERTLIYPSPAISIPILDPGKNYTYTVNISKTLPATLPSDDYRVVIDLKDSGNALIKEATWINT